LSSVAFIGTVAVFLSPPYGIRQFENQSIKETVNRRRGLRGAEISSRDATAIQRNSILVMEAAEDRYSAYQRGRRRLWWRQPEPTRGWLHAQTAMGTSMVVAHVFAEQSLGLAIVPDEHMIQAIAPQCTHDALAMRVRLRRARRCNEFADTEAAYALLKVLTVDAVAIVQQKARRHAVPGGLNDSLGSPRRGRMRRNTHVHDLAALEREDYETVEHTESYADDREEVASPDLR
jgi:hypothetical protein